MKSDDKDDKTPARQRAAPLSDRKAREAAALRANLRRRKEQQRGRQAPAERSSDDTEDR